jgi:hypothetical protein
MLDRATALLICQVVASDLRCKAFLCGPNNAVLQALGWSGGVRNLMNSVGWTFGIGGGGSGLKNALSGGTAADQADVQRVSCIGISDATTRAVSEASVSASAKTKKPAPLPSVQNAIRCDRSIDGWDHHATRVFMTDGSEYVFDWYKTLDAMNPWIYKTENWRKDSDDSTPVASFAGLDQGASPDIRDRQSGFTEADRQQGLKIQPPVIDPG